jgi:PST family polysaccharide transporter
VSWQFDRALLGYFVTKTELGQYSMATDLAVLPTQSMVGPAMVPVMAAFSRIKEDHRRLRQAYLKASRFTMLIAVPACVGMSLTADLIVHVLLGGARWNDAAVYLQWLALSAALTAYYNPLSALSLALDKPVILFRLNALELFLRVVLISIGLYLYSLMGVIAARGLVSLIMFFATLAAARNLAQLNAVAELLNLWKVAAACAVMAVCVLVARQELADALVPALELGLVAAGGAASYVGTLFVLGARWNDIKKPVE